MFQGLGRFERRLQDFRVEGLGFQISRFIGFRVFRR